MSNPTKAIDKLMARLAAFEKTPESRGHDLRLDLADLVLAGLKAKGWTQKQLAAAAGMQESFITRIVHAGSNCTFDVAGRILFALGIDAALMKCDGQRQPVAVVIPVAKAAWKTFSNAKVEPHGEGFYTPEIAGREGRRISTAGDDGLAGGFVIHDSRKPQHPHAVG